MKKQYRCKDYKFGQKILYIYHDGKLVVTKKLWLDECFNHIEELQEAGYTYGFTEEEVEEARQQYIHMLANKIEVKNG